MPRIKDLRPVLGPARSQGGRSTCLAFAVTAAHENHDVRIQPSLAVEVLYWGAKQLDGDPAPGTTFTAAATAIRQWGQPEEPFWPYDPLRDDQDPAYAPPADAIDPLNCVFAGLRQIATTAAEVTNELDQDRVVVIGTPTWRQLRRPVAGRLAIPTAADLDGGLHAMAIVGYRTDTGEFLVRNSWGQAWGEQGHAWIAMSFVDSHVVAACVVDLAAMAAQPGAGATTAEPLFGGSDG